MTTSIQDYQSSVDLLRVLLWQYNEAERLQALLTLKQDWYNTNQSQFWDDWIRDVFDLRTANAFGCAVWSIILEQTLTAELGPSKPGHKAWGFGPKRKNFGNGNFAARGRSSVRLTLDQQRTLLRLRYYQLTSRGTVPEINRFLSLMFAPEGGYVVDNLDMSFAVFVLQFQPSSSLQFVLDNFDVLPRPAGVGTRVIVEDKEIWGFGEFWSNFNRSNFHGEGGTAIPTRVAWGFGDERKNFDNGRFGA